MEHNAINNEQVENLIYLNQDVQAIKRLCYIHIIDKMDKYLRDYDNTQEYTTFINRVNLIMKNVNYMAQDNCSNTLKEKFEEFVEKYLTDYDSTNEFNQNCKRIQTILDNSGAQGFLKGKTLYVDSNNENFSKVVIFKDAYDMFKGYEEDYNSKLLSEYDNLNEFNSKMARLKRCLNTIEDLKNDNWAYAVHEEKLIKLGILKYTDKVQAPTQNKNETLSDIDTPATQYVASNKIKTTMQNQNENHLNMGFFKKLVIAFRFLLGGDLSYLLPPKLVETQENVEHLTSQENNNKDLMLTQLEKLSENPFLNETSKQLTTQIIEQIKTLSTDEHMNVSEALEIKNTCHSVLPHLFSIFNDTKNKENHNNDGKSAHDFLQESLEAVLTYLQTMNQNMQHVQLNDIEVYTSFVKSKFLKSSI